MNYIFHFYKNKKDPIILVPLLSLASDGSLKKEELQGLYGKDPDSQSINDIRTRLYSQIDKIISSSISDKYTLPRVMIALTVFIATYLFLSVVIPDPIPQIDEILFAAGSAFATNWYVKKRQKQGDDFKQIESKAKEQIDKVRFEPNDFLIRLEQILQDLSKARKEKLDFKLELSDFIAFLQDVPNSIVTQLIYALAEYMNLEKKKKIIHPEQIGKKLVISYKEMSKEGTDAELVSLYFLLQKAESLINIS